MPGVRKVKETWDPPRTDQPAKVGNAFIRTVTVEARDVPGMMLPALHVDAPDGLRVYPGASAIYCW
jgi:hypothetical protein